MKCSNCGFTYDNEEACPICGAAAPWSQPAATPENNYFAQPAPVSNRDFVIAPEPEVEPQPAKKPSPERQKGGNGLKIATLCALCVIAAALVASVVLQALRFAQERQYYKNANSLLEQENRLLEQFPDEAAGHNSTPIFVEPDGNDYITPKTLSDGKVRKIGEAYSFEYGSVLLQSVRLTGTQSLDKATQSAAFTVVIKNTTDKTLVYNYPMFNVGDTEFEEENYLYSDFDRGGDTSITLKPDESLTAVYYYNLPKQNQKLDCIINVYCMGTDSAANGSESEFSAAATYEFETKDVK